MGRATSLATALFAGCVLLNLLAVASGPAAATTSVATTAAAATTACAAPPSAPVSGTWTCSFDDEFAGASLDRTTWVPQTSGFVTGTAAYHACYVDDPRVVAQSGGALHLSVVTTSELHSCDPNLSATNLIGGMVTTHHQWSQQYGVFEVRARLQALGGPGAQETLWLWPDDRYNSTAWPAAGEIDFAEFYSQYAQNTVPFLHYTANDNGGSVVGTNTAYCGGSRGDWHTYGLVWSATKMEIYVDGTLCLTNTSGDPAFQKPYIWDLTQALGLGDNALSGQSQLPITMDVDYVRAWR
jgi:beta-glucanase (GH16 family)